MKHLICVGACCLDTILTVPHYPREDAKLRATSVQTRRGGNCPNTLEVLQQLLARTPQTDERVVPHLVSTLPAAKSPDTERILRSFGAKPLVDFRDCLFRSGHTEAASSYIFRSEATGSRTLVNYNGLPEMTLQEFADIAKGFKHSGRSWWHFEGRIPETTLACIKYLRSILPNARISVEVEKPGRQGLEELAAQVDVVFYSKAWAEDKGYRSAKECLEGEAGNTPKASLLLCTWGSEEAAALRVNPIKDIIICPVKAVKVVDAVGAGDTFIAGILYGILCHPEWETEKKLRFAVELSSKKVQREGFDRLGADMLPDVSQPGEPRVAR